MKRRCCQSNPCKYHDILRYFHSKSTNRDSGRQAGGAAVALTAATSINSAQATRRNMGGATVPRPERVGDRVGASQLPLPSRS